MNRKYQNDTVVYNWFFDLHTAELKCQELTVYRWDYMDGMQWQVVDEYQLLKEYTVPFLKFWKKKKTDIIRRPGYIISEDKEYAKLLILHEMIKSIGHVLEQEHYTMSDGTLKAVIIAQAEYKKFSDDYPELLLKVASEFKPEESNSGWLWA